MSYADAESAIRQRFIAAWTTTPIDHENVGFDPQSVAATAPFPSGGPWVQLEIEWVQANQVSMGQPSSNLFRAEGLVSVHCFVPVNTGKAALSAMVDRANTIFRGQQFNGTATAIRIRAGFPARAMPDGEWYRAAATFRVQADDLG